jgi:HlyD family secretion protein
MKKIIIQVLLPVLIAGCSGRDDLSDAYGNFETIEYLISAEGSGKILKLDLEEGAVLAAGQVVGIIDTIPLHLQIAQLKAKIKAINTQKSGVRSQIEVQKTQKQNLLVEKKRLENLLKDNAATGKQMDDLNGQLNTLEQQIIATQSSYETIDSEMTAMKAQIKMVEDQLRRNIVVNPMEGTVLEKFAEPFEMAQAGKALYKIADLKRMILRVYISGDQLADVRIGQLAEVLIDNGDEDHPSLEGKVTWISDKSEFTPKIIQTKEERVNLVYAVKVEIRNDGRLKIGMPGEVNFPKPIAD